LAEDPYLELLKKAMERAYAPYSGFPVGAVVKSNSGKLYSGTNMENAAYPQGWCAETSAIAAMVMAGEQQLVEVAVMAEGEKPCPPCGGCRQKLWEFALPGTRVLVYSPQGLKASWLLENLLPHAFGGDHLK
jgi:cytidine deaminase|tara:strand:- start:298 stop:693 length:396 start_codon:yes stop_codon:yes gene_type:complete